MSQWNFDYDNGLFLYVPETEIDSFTLSAFYKRNQNLFRVVHVPHQ